MGIHDPLAYLVEGSLESSVRRLAVAETEAYQDEEPPCQVPSSPGPGNRSGLEAYRPCSIPVVLAYLVEVPVEASVALAGHAGDGFVVALLQA